MFRSENRVNQLKCVLASLNRSPKELYFIILLNEVFNLPSRKLSMFQLIVLKSQKDRQFPKSDHFVLGNQTRFFKMPFTPRYRYCILRKC